MRDAASDAALAAWRALPRATRRHALRLAVLCGEPHPDPAVAAAASTYAQARLPRLRRVPAVLPFTALAAALTALVALAVLTRSPRPADWPGNDVLLPLLIGMVAALGGVGWCLAHSKLIPQRLRRLAAAGPAEAGQVVIRYRSRRAARVPAVAWLAASAACLALAGRSVLLSGLLVLSVPLAGRAVASFRRTRRGLPAPAACRMSSGGLMLMPRPGEPGGRGGNRAGSSPVDGGRELPWPRLERIVVLDPEPGSRCKPLIALIDQAGAPRLVPVWPERPVSRPAQWARNNISPLVLDTAELDSSADEIVAVLAGHAAAPVEHRVLPEPRLPAARASSHA